MAPEQVGYLTYNELDVMIERYNEMKKNEYEMERNVIFNAIINANRKKNSRPIPLFNENDDEKSIEEIMEERAELFGN